MTIQSTGPTERTFHEVPLDSTDDRTNTAGGSAKVEKQLKNLPKLAGFARMWKIELALSFGRFSSRQQRRIYEALKEDILDIVVGHHPGGRAAITPSALAGSLIRATGKDSIADVRKPADVRRLLELVCSAGGYKPTAWKDVAELDDFTELLMGEIGRQKEKEAEEEREKETLDKKIASDKIATEGQYIKEQTPAEDAREQRPSL